MNGKVDNWSYTWVSRWNKCQLQVYYMRYAPQQLIVKDEMSEAALAGIEDHKIIEKWVNDPRAMKSVPEHLAGAIRWVKKLHAPGPKPQAEIAYDLNEKLEHVSNPRRNWRDVWLRLRIDAWKWNKSRTRVVLLDWKTGKSDYVDKLQLKLYPAVLFQLYPKLETVDVGYVFTRSGNTELERYTRDQALELWEPFQQFLDARERAKQTNVYTHDIGHHCNWCPARDVCAARKAIK